MNKIFLKDKQNLIEIKININENIKTLYYTCEYIFSKSYTYKLIENNIKTCYKLFIKNHYFKKNNSIMLYNKICNIKLKIDKVDKNHIFIKRKNIIIPEKGYIKLTNPIKVKQFIYNGIKLDPSKKFTMYNINDNSILNYL